MNIYYKLVDLESDKLKFLFHGVNRDRTIKFNRWIKADIKQVRDGSDSKWYTSGFHILPTLEDTKKYLQYFKYQDCKRIVTCHASGIREKSHSPHPVLLADHIKFIEQIRL